MRRETRIFILALVVTLPISWNACSTAPTETTGGPVTPSPALAPTLTPTPAPSNDTDSLSITLPVLDAFFVDAAFQTELKKRLGLSDEQINRLRAVAREETASLRETASNSDSYSAGEHSATAARMRAQERITAILGAEKAAQLYALTRERWDDGAIRSANEGEAPAPSVTPTVAAPPKTSLPNTIPDDTRIVINAPAYRMDIFESGRLVKTYRIGIGYPEFPLPAGMRKADVIIFNPTWTPPDEPWVSKEKVGQKVEAGSELNPLGLVKIPIGGPSLIHGGKSPARLGGFASHGCVGLTNAQVIDFSKRLAELGGVKITDMQIAEYRQNRAKTKYVSLRQPIPVELRYETIVVEDGKLYIYRDVYERGTNSEENLRNALGAYGITLESLSESERSLALAALGRMGRNANGKEVPAASPLLSVSTGQSPRVTRPNRRKDISASPKMTRRVKGEKAMMIEIAALAGKGYAAPVELDTGNEQPRPARKSQATAQGRR